MRSDMHELLVERPRGPGGCHAWRNEEVRAARCELRAARTEEDFDTVRRPQGTPRVGIRRWLNENLAPLRRFLLSRVGQPWDRVYSELRSQLDMRSPIQLHIMQHLHQYVAVRARREPDGTWLACNHWGLWHALYWRQDLVVDPRSGLLVQVKRASPPVVVRRPDHHRGPDGQVYTRVEGIWWAVTLDWMADRSSPDGGDDVLLNAPARTISRGVRDALYGHPMAFATSRRPLNRRELKALGLWRR